MTVGKLLQALAGTDPTLEIMIVTGISQTKGNLISDLNLVYEEQGGVVFDTNKAPSQPENIKKLLATTFL